MLDRKKVYIAASLLQNSNTSLLQNSNVLGLFCKFARTLLQNCPDSVEKLLFCKRNLAIQSRRVVLLEPTTCCPNLLCLFCKRRLFCKRVYGAISLLQNSKVLGLFCNRNSEPTSRFLAKNNLSGAFSKETSFFLQKRPLLHNRHSNSEPTSRFVRAHNLWL